MNFHKVFVILLGLTAPLLGLQSQLDNVTAVEDVTSQFPMEAAASVKSSGNRTVILTETALYQCPAGSAQCAQPQKIVSENELPTGQKLVAKDSPTQSSYQTRLTLGEKSLYFASACPAPSVRIYPDGSRVSVTTYGICTVWKLENYQTLKKVAAIGDSVQASIPAFFAGTKTVTVADVSEIWPSVDGTREFVLLQVTWDRYGARGLFEIIGGVFQNLRIESTIPTGVSDVSTYWNGGIWADGDNIFFIQGNWGFEGQTLLRFNKSTKQTEVFFRSGQQLFGETIRIRALDHNFEVSKLFIRYSNGGSPPRYTAPIGLASLTDGKLERIVGSDSQILISSVGGIAANSQVRLLPIFLESNGKFVDALGFQFVSGQENGISILLKVGDSILGRPVERLDSNLVAVHGCNADIGTQKADGSPDRWYRFSFVCTQQAPPPEILGVTNGASFDLNQPLAPGTIFSLFGKNLGTAESARAWPLPRKLGDAKVTICGVDAPLFANTGPMTRLEGGQLWQINGVVPNIAFSPSCEVVISVDQKSPTASLTAKGSVKISSRPEETLALFTFTGFHPNGAQTQEPIITNQQGQLIAPLGVTIPGANPSMFAQARACEVITLWATGGGKTIPPVADGESASGTSLARMETTPAIQIYGVDAEVLFAGLAPGFAGLNQINVRVPCEATPGEQWLWFGKLPNPAGKTYKIWVQ